LSAMVDLLRRVSMALKLMILKQAPFLT
ncbi:uncharacterized protein METZ01_LOCUS393753, partial [marine metagenome]